MTFKYHSRFKVGRRKLNIKGSFTIGKKGGTSATAGKKSATYIVELPDGTERQKRTFYAKEPVATAFIYEHESNWHIAAVRDDIPDNMRHYQTVTARRK